MVVIGVILIVAVGLDAWRRVRSDRYSRVKVKLIEEGAEPAEENSRDTDLNWLKELPNGGARVVQRSDLINATARAAARKERESAAAAPAKTQPEAPPSQNTPVPPEPEPADPADDGLIAGMSSADDAEPATLDWLDNVSADGATAAPAAKPPAGKLPRAVDPEVFMLNVLARGRDGFRGEDVLHILLACDLRFGDMSFFHRHEFEAGRGAIQFSVANMMQPGVFDIDNMADFNTPGLVFFLTLPGPEDMMKAFDYMLETAQAVARNLDGDVLDESRSALTKQSMEHCRQQIRDLERRMLARTT